MTTEEELKLERAIRKKELERQTVQTAIDTKGGIVKRYYGGG